MNPSGHPLVSIIIPVYNDPKGIETTLKSILSNTSNNEDYEVLVVDNASTDNTKNTIRQFSSENPKIRLLVESDIQSSYAARNKGIRESEGAVIVFIDANMTVDESWLPHLVKSIERNDAHYIGCNVEVTIEENDQSLVAEYNGLTAFPIKRYLDNDRFVPTCCLVVTDNLIEDVGYFDDRMISGGDMEFGQRVYQAGFIQRFEKNVTVYHPARSSLWEVLTKMFRVGRGLAQYSYYYPERFDKHIWRQPGGYLPPHPFRFRQRMRSDYDIQSTWKIVIFYLINYSVRLARTFGAIYQISNIWLKR